MRYQSITHGVFISRPNRFLAQVEIAGQVHTVHVKNTGRCRELLVPGAKVILEHHVDFAETGRKTEFSLVGVYKGEILINMDSQAPNQAAREWLKQSGWLRQSGGLQLGGRLKRSGRLKQRIIDVRREVKYGNSRFDLAFQIENRDEAGDVTKIMPAFMEVKGVTLERHGTAMFPDAPTERGVKHLLELKEAVSQGYQAYVLFVIQMKGVKEFRPNHETHEEFARTLKMVSDAGVQVMAYDCLVREDGFCIDQPVPVCLGEKL